MDQNHTEQSDNQSAQIDEKLPEDQQQTQFQIDQTKRPLKGKELIEKLKQDREKEKQSKQEKISKEDEKECTFTPKINKYKSNLNRGDGMPVHDYLYQMGQQYDKHKESIRKQKEQQLIDQQQEQERRLREKIAKLNRSYPDPKNMESNQVEDKILMRSGQALQNYNFVDYALQECTFKPEINKITQQQREKLNIQREGKSTVDYLYEKGKENISKLRGKQNDDTIILKGKDAEDLYREMLGSSPKNNQYKLAKHFENRIQQFEERKRKTQEREEQLFQEQMQQYKPTGISDKLKADFERLKQEAQENRAKKLEAQQKAEQAKLLSMMSYGSIQLTKSKDTGIDHCQKLYEQGLKRQQAKKKEIQVSQVEQQSLYQSSTLKQDYKRPQFTQQSTGYSQRIKELDKAKKQYLLKQQLKEQKEHEEAMKKELEEQRLRKIDKYLEQQKKQANQSLESLGEEACNARVMESKIKGYKRFLDNQMLALSYKKEADRRLNKNLPAWHLEPTRTVQDYKVAEDKKPKEIQEDVVVTDKMEKFFNMVYQEMKNGVQADNSRPQPQKMVQTTTSVLDLAVIGERQKVPTIGGIFTKFHKLASQIQAQNFNRQDYVNRRILREQEVQLLSQSLTNSGTFQSGRIGEKSVKLQAE